MKRILLFLLSFGITVSSSFAQDPSEIINIDLDENGSFFADAGTIPQGQKIKLIGKEGKTVFQKIDIEVSTFNGKQSFPAKINDDNWEIEIGPFQPRQLITLTIKALRKTGNDGKIGKLLSDGLNKAMPVINAKFNEGGGIDPNVLKTKFFSTLKVELGNSVNNYFIDVDKKLIDNLTAVIDTNCLFSTIGGSCGGEMLLNILGSISKANSIIKETDTSTASNRQRIEVAKTNLNEQEGKLNQFTKDLTAKIKFNLILTTLPVSSVDLRASGLEYYAGFDVSALVFDKELGATGLYFTISPYVFGKFDPELDFSDVKRTIPAKIKEKLSDGNKNPEWKEGMNKQRNKLIAQNISSWLKYHISPTVGIAFSGNADVPNSPQLFAGASLRLNRLFKITTGSVFYRDSSSTGGKKYIHNFSLGMSLNISYLGTVMQMLGAATRSVKNQ